jgi:hypothetical protein
LPDSHGEMEGCTLAGKVDPLDVCGVLCRWAGGHDLGVGVHFGELARRTGVESLTTPEEVSMHPMMIMAMAREVEKERQHERHQVQLRTLALANRAQGFDGSAGGRGFAWRCWPVLACGPSLPYGFPGDRLSRKRGSR